METESFPSVYITDGIFPSVIPLLFSDFLVVNLVHFQPFPMQHFQIFNPNDIQTSYGLNACIFVIQNIFYVFNFLNF